MKGRRIFRFGQIAGGVAMLAGIVACNVAEHEGSAMLALIGAVVCTGCRLAADVPRQ